MKLLFSYFARDPRQLQGLCKRPEGLVQGQKWVCRKKVKSCLSADSTCLARKRMLSPMIYVWLYLELRKFVLFWGRQFGDWEESGEVWYFWSPIFVGLLEENYYSCKPFLFHPLCTPKGFWPHRNPNWETLRSCPVDVKQRVDLCLRCESLCQFGTNQFYLAIIFTSWKYTSVFVK